ncbi:MAG: formyl transferase [Candidatus Parabeggiatoa sp.]|nr:formyl transferase [Candidatus Parabeggiatoa sp.]
MKIVICVKRDLEGNIALNKIVQDLQGHDLLVLLSDHFMKTERENQEAARFIFYERDLLVEQIFPLLEAVPLSKHQPRYLTFEQIRQVYGVPILITRNVNDAESETLIRSFDPDVMLSVRFDFIFRPHIIALPKLGILNVHPGALPRYRGVYAPFRAMLYGEEKIGCTLHFIDEGIDTGPIVGIQYMPVDYKRSVLWHIAHLYPLGIDMFVESIPLMECGELPPADPQLAAEQHYYTFPTPEEFKQFKERGFSLIDDREYLNFLLLYRSPEL